MADFDTLVPDIYSLFGEEKVEINEELLEKFGQNLMAIKRDRLNRNNSDPVLYISNVGKPDRQLWYDLNWKGEVEKMLPQAYVKFLYGDILEQMLIFLAQVAGHEVTALQERVEIDGIRGKMDCKIDGVIVDVKSASSYSFKKFEDRSLLQDGNDPFGYVAQLAGYVKAHERLYNERPDGAFLAIDKTLGKICTLRISNEVLNQYHIEDRIHHVKEMVQQPEPPERCYSPAPEGKSGNFRLDTGCSYCRHKFHCWSDANGGQGLLTFIYAGGPKYLTHVERQPRVSQEGIQEF